MNEVSKEIKESRNIKPLSQSTDCKKNKKKKIVKNNYFAINVSDEIYLVVRNLGWRHWWDDGTL